MPTASAARPGGRRWLVALIALAVLGVGSFLAALALRRAAPAGGAVDAPVAIDASIVPIRPIVDEIELDDAAAPADAPTTAEAPDAPGAPAAPPPATLKLDTLPRGGSVRVGDQRYQAPVALTLPPGAYVVHAELDGWQPVQRDVELVAGAIVVQELPFTRRAGRGGPSRGEKTGRLTVKTEPYSDVFLGGRRIGQTPLAEVVVPAGRHVLTFKHPARAPVTRAVTIVAGKTTKVPTITLP